MLYENSFNLHKQTSTDELLSLLGDLPQRDSGNSSHCSSASSSCHNEATTSNVDKKKQIDSAEFCLKLNKATVDMKLLNDERLVKNLLDLEDFYRVQSNYFQHVQTEIKPWMRKMLANWMLDVCRNQSREEDVFVLAMNILDRFLSVQHISKRHLQLLGTVCMFIAAKLRSAIQFNAETLVIYTANSITIEDLLSWEQFVLHKLRWDICSVTPNDFLPHLLNRFNIVDNELIRQTVSSFIAVCAADFRFSMVPSSMIASACFFAAIKSLNTLSQSKGVQILEQINELTSIDLECLKEVIEQVEELAEAHFKIELKFAAAETSIESEEHILISYSNMEITC